MVLLRFGDRVNPHLRHHALATDDSFDRGGLFYPMPFDMQGDIEVLERLFARRGLDLIRAEAAEPKAPGRDAGVGAQRFLG